MGDLPHVTFPTQSPFAHLENGFIASFLACCLAERRVDMKAALENAEATSGVYDEAMEKMEMWLNL